MKIKIKYKFTQALLHALCDRFGCATSIGNLATVPDPYSDWKTWKSGKAFSTPGKIREITQNTAKVREFLTNFICHFCDIVMNCIFTASSCRLPASDIWWSSLKTCSNLFTWGPTPCYWHLVVATKTHKWESGGMHLTGMLSRVRWNGTSFHLKKKNKKQNIKIILENGKKKHWKSHGTLSVGRSGNRFGEFVI